MDGPAPSPHSIAEFVDGYENGRTIRGFRCRACGNVTATWGLACSRCGARPLEEATFPATGTIVAGTIVAVASDEFVNDAPYAYVLVELEGGGRVTGWMPSVKSEKDLTIGEPVHFVAGYKPGVQFVKDSEAAPSA